MKILFNWFVPMLIAASSLAIHYMDFPYESEALNVLGFVVVFMALVGFAFLVACATVIDNHDIQEKLAGIIRSQKKSIWNRIKNKLWIGGMWTASGVFVGVGWWWMLAGWGMFWAGMAAFRYEVNKLRKKLQVVDSHTEYLKTQSAE